jgi:hypothetical protein
MGVKERDKRGKEHEEWRDSIEGVLYDLMTFGKATVEEEKDVYIIAKTLLRLPKDVRDKVLDEVCFIIAHEQAAAPFKVFIGSFVINKLASTGKIDLSREEDPLVRLSVIEDIAMYFILLNFAAMEGMTEDDKMSIIAHEIAHFVLGHNSYSPKERNAEKEADDLAEKWGFKRAYKSYEYAP